MMPRLFNTSTAQLLSQFELWKTVYFYSGEMPIVNDDFVFAPANFADRLLGKTNTLYCTATVPQAALSLNSSVGIPTFTAQQAGKVTWCVIVDADTADGHTRALLLSVTNLSSANDPVLLNMVDVVQGDKVSIIDLRFKLGF